MCVRAREHGMFGGRDYSNHDSCRCGSEKVLCTPLCSGQGVRAPPEDHYRGMHQCSRPRSQVKLLSTWERGYNVPLS